MVSKAVVSRLAKKYRIDTDVIPIDVLKKATEIESEHKQVIGNDPEAWFTIVINHLDEYPDYYDRLIRMEAQAEKYWSTKVKPMIYY